MVGTFVMLTAVGVLVWAVRRGRRGMRNGAIVAIVAGLALAQFEANLAEDYEPGPPSRHGLSANRVENECLDRVANQLVSPGSMRVIGNPVGVDPVWDPTEDEWRWIVDVTGVNAFNVRIRGRFQCIVRAGPSWLVRQVN
jgi:hypothetical protein